mgnify:CR=1 FL=1
MKRKKFYRYGIVSALIVFATSTLFMSSSVLFDWFGIREREGNYVAFIVWTNFIAGFLYLIAAYGLLFAKKWALWVLVATLLLLVCALIILGLYINYGGDFELKNVGAMIFRIIVTIIFSVLGYFNLKK